MLQNEENDQKLARESGRGKRINSKNRFRKEIMKKCSIINVKGSFYIQWEIRIRFHAFCSRNPPFSFKDSIKFDLENRNDDEP